MKLTVLGKSPSWQDAGGACSGYLVEDGDTAVVIDCGNGVFSKLRQFRDYVDVDAVVLSHLHADHFLDLVPFSYALTYAPRQQPVPVDRWPGTDDPARPRCTRRPARATRSAGWRGRGGPNDLIENAFDLREYEEEDELEIGSLRVTFQGVPHFIDTYAMRLSTTNGGGKLVYGADCSPTEALKTFAADADLMLVEATLPRPERTGERGHLTPREAGEHARAAHVGRLVLTHISDELDAEWARAEAEAAFDGPVEVGCGRGAVYEV